jgi:uncharacterized protein YbbK (DUF523 family)
MIIVSACLAGVACRYNGNAFPIPAIIAMFQKGTALPVCPEMLAGLPAPRPPAELRNGRVLSNSGEDVTEEFLLGAKMGLAIALAARCRKAIVKAKSPTCGSGSIYDGTFSGKVIPGDGVFSKLLKEYGIEVITEEDLED